MLGEKCSLFVPLLAAKRAPKPAKRPQKPANERKSQKVGQLGCLHALPAQKHALIGHRCRGMLATGNARTDKGNYIDMISNLVGSNILPNGQQHLRRQTFVLAFQLFVLERPVFLQSYPLPKTARNFWVVQSPGLAILVCLPPKRGTPTKGRFLWFPFKTTTKDSPLQNGIQIYEFDLADSIEVLGNRLSKQAFKLETECLVQERCTVWGTNRVQHFWAYLCGRSSGFVHAFPDRPAQADSMFFLMAHDRE